ncbi:hypothetical protein EBT25_04025 [bacterium]|nr:hypothetical protein [bacterium]
MQYWIDRVRIFGGPEHPVVTPVSFVVPPEHVDALHSLAAPEDELVTDVSEATKPWTFVIKPGDVFPVQIVASIQTTLDAAEPFDAMMFPIVYRGHVVEERRLFKTAGEYANTQRASMPIFNLNKPVADTSAA